jgi:hypothetical protein
MFAKHLTWSRQDAANRRHICIVTETYPPEINGVALTLAHLVDGLRQQGHTVSVVRPRQQSVDGPSRSYDPTVTLVPGLPLPGYKGLHLGLPASGILRRCWTRRRPDVVYVATEGPLGWSGVRATQRLGIPVFSGFHTNFDSYSEHYHLGCLRFLILRYLCRFHNRTIGTIVGSLEAARKEGDNAASAMKNVVVDPKAYDREGDTPLHRPSSRTIIYEMHVRGFTRYPCSGVAEKRRGTFAGLIEKVPYLQELGVTTVELMSG